ncbi:hypothetical protein BESB_007930 [Besnoitia besnoiti]|uniref:Protein kinase domain-containing protein n=1 Tax=Besnoitia besnoiti TaxID=94643 RepID=A0A2A9MP80_BESBE|nr:hypothetical protein BESB_007930 [Besnoitia besnoiti]PFH38451.1 hypothetical protein BESB_007930 [Besnoitia besnoiti]
MKNHIEEVITRSQAEREDTELVTAATAAAPTGVVLRFFRAQASGELEIIRGRNVAGSEGALLFDARDRRSGAGYTVKIFSVEDSVVRAIAAVWKIFKDRSVATVLEERFGSSKNALESGILFPVLGTMLSDAPSVIRPGGKYPRIAFLNLLASSSRRPHSRGYIAGGPYTRVRSKIFMLTRRLIRIFGDLDTSKLCHGDLNPDNIVVMAETEDVALTAFGESCLRPMIIFAYAVGFSKVRHDSLQLGNVARAIHNGGFTAGALDECNNNLFSYGAGEKNVRIREAITGLLCCGTCKLQTPADIPAYSSLFGAYSVATILRPEPDPIKYLAVDVDIMQGSPPSADGLAPPEGRPPGGDAPSGAGTPAGSFPVKAETYRYASQALVQNGSQPAFLNSRYPPPSSSPSFSPWLPPSRAPTAPPAAYAAPGGSVGAASARRVPFLTPAGGAPVSPFSVSSPFPSASPFASPAPSLSPPSSVSSPLPSPPVHASSFRSPSASLPSSFASYAAHNPYPYGPAAQEEEKFRRPTGGWMPPSAIAAAAAAAADVSPPSGQSPRDLSPIKWQGADEAGPSSESVSSPPPGSLSHGGGALPSVRDGRSPQGDSLPPAPLETPPRQASAERAAVASRALATAATPPMHAGKRAETRGAGLTVFEVAEGGSAPGGATPPEASERRSDSKGETSSHEASSHSCSTPASSVSAASSSAPSLPSPAAASGAAEAPANALKRAASHVPAAKSPPPLPASVRSPVNTRRQMPSNSNPRRPSPSSFSSYSSPGESSQALERGLPPRPSPPSAPSEKMEDVALVLLRQQEKVLDLLRRRREASAACLRLLKEEVEDETRRVQQLEMRVRWRAQLLAETRGCGRGHCGELLKRQRDKTSDGRLPKSGHATAGGHVKSLEETRGDRSHEGSHDLSATPPGATSTPEATVCAAACPPAVGVLASGAPAAASGASSSSSCSTDGEHETAKGGGPVGNAISKELVRSDQSQGDAHGIGTEAAETRGDRDGDKRVGAGEERGEGCKGGAAALRAGAHSDDDFEEAEDDCLSSAFDAFLQRKILQTSVLRAAGEGRWQIVPVREGPSAKRMKPTAEATKETRLAEGLARPRSEEPDAKQPSVPTCSAPSYEASPGQRAERNGQEGGSRGGQQMETAETPRSQGAQGSLSGACGDVDESSGLPRAAAECEGGSTSVEEEAAIGVTRPASAAETQPDASSLPLTSDVPLQLLWISAEKLRKRTRNDAETSAAAAEVGEASAPRQETEGHSDGTSPGAQTETEQARLTAPSSAACSPPSSSSSISSRYLNRLTIALSTFTWRDPPWSFDVLSSPSSALSFASLAPEAASPPPAEHSPASASTASPSRAPSGSTVKDAGRLFRWERVNEAGEETAETLDDGERERACLALLQDQESHLAQTEALEERREQQYKHALSEYRARFYKLRLQQLHETSHVAALSHMWLPTGGAPFSPFSAASSCRSSLLAQSPLAPLPPAPAGDVFASFYPFGQPLAQTSAAAGPPAYGLGAPTVAAFAGHGVGQEVVAAAAHAPFASFASLRESAAPLHAGPSDSAAAASRPACPSVSPLARGAAEDGSAFVRGALGAGAAAGLPEGSAVPAGGPADGLGEAKMMRGREGSVGGPFPTSGMQVPPPPHALVWARGGEELAVKNLLAQEHMGGDKKKRKTAFVRPAAVRQAAARQRQQQRQRQKLARLEQERKRQEEKNALREAGALQSFSHPESVRPVLSGGDTHLKLPLGSPGAATAALQEGSLALGSRAVRSGDICLLAGSVDKRPGPAPSGLGAWPPLAPQAPSALSGAAVYPHASSSLPLPQAPLLSPARSPRRASAEGGGASAKGRGSRRKGETSAASTPRATPGASPFGSAVNGAGLFGPQGDARSPVAAAAGSPSAARTAGGDSLGASSPVSSACGRGLPEARVRRGDGEAAKRAGAAGAARSQSRTKAEGEAGDGREKARKNRKNAAEDPEANGGGRREGPDGRARD